MAKYQQVWESLKDEEYRQEFSADVDTTLAFQIRLLREKNNWTQQQLAEHAGSKQETISQWENPNYGSYTLKTLKALAKAFDVGLMVKFAPFSELVEWNVNLTPERLAPRSFDEELGTQLQNIVVTPHPVVATAAGVSVTWAPPRANIVSNVQHGWTKTDDSLDKYVAGLLDTSQTLEAVTSDKGKVTRLEKPFALAA